MFFYIINLHNLYVKNIDCRCNLHLIISLEELEGLECVTACGDDELGGKGRVWPRVCSAR